MSRVSEAVARPTRTGVQMGVGAVIVEFLAAFWLSFDERQYAISVVAAGIVVGFVQVLVENHAGAALLRRVPPTDVPVADGPPAA